MPNKIASNATGEYLVATAGNYDIIKKRSVLHNHLLINHDIMSYMVDFNVIERAMIAYISKIFVINLMLFLFLLKYLLVDLIVLKFIQENFILLLLILLILIL